MAPDNLWGHLTQDSFLLNGPRKNVLVSFVEWPLDFLLPESFVKWRQMTSLPESFVKWPKEIFLPGSFVK